MRISLFSAWRATLRSSIQKIGPIFRSSLFRFKRFSKKIPKLTIRFLKRTVYRAKFKLRKHSLVAIFRLPHERMRGIAAILLIVLGFGFLHPSPARAGNSFLATFDQNTFTANNALGSNQATASSPPPTFVSPGTGNQGSSVFAGTGQSLSYDLANNLDPGRSKIDVSFKAGFNSSATGAQHIFYHPAGMVFDSTTSYVYFLSVGTGQLIRTKMDGTGWLTFGSNGNGIGQFANPSSLAYDPTSGFFYIADSGNNRIVRTRMDGTGWLTLGTGGSGTNQFNYLNGIAFDSITNYVYVSDSGNNRIVRTRMDGTGWLTLGTGGSGTNQFSYTYGIYIDTSSGYLYIADHFNNRIVKTKIDGTGWTTLAAVKVEQITLNPSNHQIYAISRQDSNIYLLSSQIDGSNQSSILLDVQPYGLAYDQSSGKLYLGDGNSNTITSMNSNGSNIAILSSDNNENTNFSNISKLAYDFRTKDVFIIQQQGDGNNIIRSTINGADRTTTHNSSYNPQGIYYDRISNFLYLTDNLNNQIIKMRPDGSNITTYGSYGSGVGNFDNPQGIFYDNASGDIFVADTYNNRVVKTQIDGSDWQSIGSLGNGVNQFNQPTEVQADTDGNIYVLDQANNRIIKTDMDSTGWQSYGSSGNGTNQLNAPNQFVFDTDNSYLYIADTGNNRVVRAKMNGSNFAAYGGVAGNGQYQFNQPVGITFDPTTNDVYVSDGGNGRLTNLNFNAPSWLSYSGSSIHTLFTTNNTYPLWIYFDQVTSTLNAYLSLGQLSYKLSTTALDITKNNWYTAELLFDNQTGQASLSLNGANTVSFTGESWTAPNLGTSFSVGNNPIDLNQTMSGPIDDVTVTNLATDTTPPSNPTTVNLLDSPNGTPILTDSVGNEPSVQWFNIPTPTFSWSGASDSESGVSGYFVYFGTGDNLDPLTQGTFVNSATYTSNLTLVSGTTYHLLLKTRDSAGNITGTQSMFNYKYDATAPTAPGYITVSPAGTTSVNHYTFNWPLTGVDAATDPGSPNSGSGIAGYQYKTGAGSGPFSQWSSTLPAGSGSVTLDNAAYTAGSNTFSLRSVDGAGNPSDPATATYLFSSTAPSSPLNLVAAPPTSSGSPATVNKFSFSWQPPAVFLGSIKQYHYSVNALPTATNTNLVIGTSIPVGPYANQQGKNTLYVVAEDANGNINYDSYANTDFYATTPAPGAPTSPGVYDVSSRSTSTFQLSLTWQVPSQTGDSFAGYELFRSTDNHTFSSLGRTTSTNFVDSGLSNGVLYYYYIKARDNAGQYSAPSSTVSLSPFGRFTSPPTITSPPVVSAATTSGSKVNWQTNRECSSFINYDLNKTKVTDGKASGTAGQPDSVLAHNVVLTDLAPESTYYAQAVCIDIDNNHSTSAVFSFSTSTKPTISDVQVLSTSTNSATVRWTSNVVISSSVRYGLTAQYGQSQDDQSGSATTQHTVIITALQDGTAYHFRISGSSTDGSTIVSDDYAFTTKPVPRITADANFIPKANTTTSNVAVSWNTNTPTTSVIHYTDSTGYHEITKPDLTPDHTLELTDLPDKTNIELEISGTDQYSNVVTKKQIYTTPKDLHPPLISNIHQVIITNGTDQSGRSRAIISWTTNKPSTSKVLYAVGSIDKELTNSASNGTDYRLTHSVTLDNLSTGSIIAYRIVSTDQNSNQGQSTLQTAITKTAQASPLNLIVQNLSRTFGFLTIFNRLFQ